MSFVGNSFTKLRFGRKDKAIPELQHDAMMTRGRLEVNPDEFLKFVLNAGSVCRRLSPSRSAQTVERFIATKFVLLSFMV